MPTGVLLALSERVDCEQQPTLLLRLLLLLRQKNATCRRRSKEVLRARQQHTAHGRNSLIEQPQRLGGQGSRLGHSIAIAIGRRRPETPPASSNTITGKPGTFRSRGPLRPTFLAPQGPLEVHHDPHRLRGLPEDD